MPLEESPCGRLFSPVRPRSRSPALRLPTRSRARPATRLRAALAPERGGHHRVRRRAHRGDSCRPQADTPSRRKNWPAVESALRDLAKQRSERFAARASADRPKDPIERLSLRADVMMQRGAALKKARRRGRPALQEPGRGAEAPLHRAGTARRTRRARHARPTRLDASRARHARRLRWTRPDGSAGRAEAAVRNHA